MLLLSLEQIKKAVRRNKCEPLFYALLGLCLPQRCEVASNFNVHFDAVGEYEGVI